MAAPPYKRNAQLRVTSPEEAARLALQGDPEKAIADHESIRMWGKLPDQPQARRQLSDRQRHLIRQLLDPNVARPRR